MTVLLELPVFLTGIITLCKFLILIMLTIQAFHKKQQFILQKCYKIIKALKNWVLGNKGLTCDAIYTMAGKIPIY